VGCSFRIRVVPGIATILRLGKEQLMVRTNLRAAFMGLVGATLLAVGFAPDVAQAKDRGNGRAYARDGRRVERVYRPQPSRVSRQWRSYGGQRVYRDMVVIRTGNRIPRYRAWRAYSRPQYVYSRRVIRVRPVRFHVSAVIGGVAIRGSYHRPGDYLYGCNFCDSRFSTYDTYHGHVASCSHRPHGYRVECSDWDNSSNAGWWDDNEWRDDGYRDRGYSDRRDTSDRDYRDDRVRDRDDYRDGDDRDYRDRDDRDDGDDDYR
jgi:hypothetical protein